MQNLLSPRFYKLGTDFFYLCQPIGLRAPKLERMQRHIAQYLGLPQIAQNSDSLLQTCSGNYLPAHAKPLAHAYAGHQFGQFNPLLGDGRSLIIGELQTPQGRQEVMLKGTGKTPYSREADGWAGINECLHEYRISSELAQLGVPTAHCLCVTRGTQQVYRENYERRAILTRVAPSHLRFGSFEYYYGQGKEQQLRQLLDFAIEHYFPDCHALETSSARYACFLETVVCHTARLIAHWQAVGFTHGMMNTDNLSILGITLDVGASAFTPEHDPDFVSSPADEKGRYAFGQQPTVGLWNCNVLARALSPVLDTQQIKHALNQYETTYLAHLEHLQAKRP